MNYYESVVIDYLRADRAMFVNAECCVQLNQADNPDTSGAHWYCDVATCDFRTRTVFLCEVSYSRGLADLTKRLKLWHDQWDLVCAALVRDSFLPPDWPVRPWVFIPEEFVPLLVRRFEQFTAQGALRFAPRITPLEMVQPWRYRSWNRIEESTKPESIPEQMRI